MCKEVEHCLKEWDIKKVFTIIVDNASSGSSVIEKETCNEGWFCLGWGVLTHEMLCPYY